MQSWEAPQHRRHRRDGPAANRCANYRDRQTLSSGCSSCALVVPVSEAPQRSSVRPYRGFLIEEAATGATFSSKPPRSRVLGLCGTDRLIYKTVCKVGTKIFLSHLHCSTSDLISALVTLTSRKTHMLSTTPKYLSKNADNVVPGFFRK
jgi:hypothetical protein